MRVALTLPEPPSVNRIWRKARGGRLYLAPKAREFYLGVQAALLKAGITRIVFPKGVEVKYDLTWYRSRKAGDASNRLKAVEDSLNGLLWDDDKQVVAGAFRRVDGQRPGRVELVVEAA